MGQAAAWKGARLKRLICLSLSAVIVVGPLFAVAFIMIPSLRASGNEFVRNVPAYVEEIEQRWTNVVQFAAKYNVVLPEYAIDAEALTEKITAFINREGTGESAENGGSERDSTVLTLPEFIYSTYNSLLESGWRMDEIDRMDMPGFLKMRAWNARQEQKKKEPRQRYIDEVWSSLKPGGL